VAVLREGLARLGWTERNVRFEQRFAEGDYNQMQVYAAELVGSAPEVIVVNSTPALAALNQATRTIPIIFSVSDPVGQASLQYQLHQMSIPRHASLFWRC
jgi:putative tryptophan/tyrosine transport system substrate-binding protein